MEHGRKITPPPPEPPPDLRSISQRLPGLEELPGEPPSEPRGSWRSALSTITLFALAPLIALFIAAFVIQSYQVDGQSMETTLHNSDRLIVNKIPRTLSRLTKHAYVPRRGDIIIFNQNLGQFGGFNEKQLVKRVIGLPGETVKVENGSITVYSQARPQGFNPDTSGNYRITADTTPGQVPPNKLGNNEIFVAGDNRSNSEDSRYFGPVQLNKVVGKLWLRILPLSKLQSF